MRIASILGAAVAASVCSLAPASAAIVFDATNELVQVTEVSPGTFDFSQGGFSDGATVTGFFVGTDLDNNGQLSSFEGEVSDFGVTFSGNSKIGAFSLGFSSLFAVVYDLNGGPLGDGVDGDVEGIGTFNVPEYVAGAGPFGAPCDGSNICGAVVTIVPEPASWAIMLLGFSGIGWARRLARSRVAGQ